MKNLFTKRKFLLPLLAGIGVGLYPVLFYYSRNYEMVNSVHHLSRFLLYFIIVPAIAFWTIYVFFSYEKLKKLRKYVLPFLSVFVFLFFLKMCLHTGLQKKIIAGIFVVAVLSAWFLHKHLLKIIGLQYILALIGLAGLGSTLIERNSYTTEWKTQPDDIENISFNNKPNIYFIQPDGYVNFSELNQGYYQISDTSFKSFLNKKGFTTYDHFRSNYDATLSSNSSIFTMKHHYYEGSTAAHEMPNARQTIISDNPVLRILKKNGYKTAFLAENPYLVSNRPKPGYDYINFEYSELPFLDSKLELRKEITPDLSQAMIEFQGEPSFFFIEIFDPKHISGSKKGENLVEEKRREYIRDLENANRTLTNVIETILSKDEDGIIVLMADHGGYVGMEYLQQGNEFTTDQNKIRSIFSSLLSIRWPEGNAPPEDDKFKTSVNVFRLLFSYLSEDKSLLDHLQEDSSYMKITSGAEEGVYKVIDENGVVISSIRER
ncbi:MAG: sulfatase-like hydrolase/transferase [Flavobacteriaceae bacterium]|nr:sulfatase-like hydrolase/transferase [Flavobacteriaceae bacterium]